jgi:ATP-grasp domain
LRNPGMNVVFISPHFPPNWYLFCVRLREAGATVLGIGDAPYHDLRPELQHALTEYYRVDDMHSYDQLVRAFGHLTHRHGKIDRLDSLNEYWLEIEAKLRTDFNIAGIKNADIARMKRKSLMKRMFERAGLRVGRGKVCRSPRAVREFIGLVGYPVVAKPDAGVGAAATYKLETDQDVERFLAEKPKIDYILEEFLSGTLLTYDGLTNRRGDVVFGSSFFYSQGVMEAVNDDTDIWYCITRDVPPDIEAAGKAIIRAFRIRERPFHFEFFRQQDGSVVPLEINVRPPGGFTVDMFNFANDFDFYREWANVVVHGRFDAVLTRPYSCAYVGRKNRLDYVHSHDEVLRKFGPMILFHTPMSGVFARAIGDYGYILRDPDEARLRDAALWIQEKAPEEPAAIGPAAARDAVGAARR